jgi:hypothetical protein
MESRYEDLRSIVIAELRRDVLAGHGRRDGNITPRFVQNLSEDDSIIVWSVFYDLVRQGLIVPGRRTSLSQHGGSTNDFPAFSFTPYGVTVIASASADIDPHQGRAYVQAVEAKISQPSEIMRTYLAESVESFRSEHFLAAAVLLGVASEDLLERLYVAYEAHLPVNRRPQFTESLRKKRGSAEGRYNVFWKSYEQHLTEVDDELRRRIETHLGMLTSFLKLSRDDAGHARFTRVTREVAHMNLVALPVVVGIVAELESALKSKCSLK